MYQSDWLLRQIEQMGDVLRRLIAALREHRPEDAIRLSRKAAGELLETDPDLIASLSADGLLALLCAGGALDTFRAHMLAELTIAHADALEMQGAAEAAARDRDRARTLLAATLPLVADEQLERVHELLEWLEERT